MALLPIPARSMNFSTAVNSYTLPKYQQTTFPPLESMDSIIARINSQYQLDPEMEALNRELALKSLEANEAARGAGQQYQNSLNAPPPQLEAPPFSPFQQMGNLVSGNVAAMLMKQPELAQAPMQNMQRMQHMALKTAEQQRELNLEMLLKNYEQKRIVAQQAGDLETSIKTGERIKSIYDKREAVVKAGDEQRKTLQGRDEFTAKENSEIYNQQQKDLAKYQQFQMSLGSKEGKSGLKEALDYLGPAQAHVEKITDAKIARAFMKNTLKTAPMFTDFDEARLFYSNYAGRDGKPIWNANDPKDVRDLANTLVTKNPTGALEWLWERSKDDPAFRARIQTVYGSGNPNVGEALKLYIEGPKDKPTASEVTAEQQPSRFMQVGGGAVRGVRDVGLFGTAPIRAGFNWMFGDPNDSRTLKDFYPGTPDSIPFSPYSPKEW